MPKINRICYFNWYHNGDIHVSRTFVDKISRFYNLPAFYLHKNNCDVIKDVNITTKNLKHNLDQNTRFAVNDGCLYFNTWYGVEKFKYINKYGITYNCLYHIFDDTIKEVFGNSLNDISSSVNDFFPNINFEKFNINCINEFIKNNSFNKKIFVSNEIPYSGQCKNINMDNILSNMVRQNQNKLFLFSSPTKISGKNVLYTGEIIKQKYNLNENAYLSGFCDIIIGRLTGPHTFCYNTYNFFDSSKIIISITGMGYFALWYKKEDFALNYNSSIVIANDSNVSNIISVITNKIKEI